MTEHAEHHEEWTDAPLHVRHSIRRGEREISRLTGLHLPYTFGGGRNCGPKICPDGPFDCSAFVIRVCDVIRVPILDGTGSTYSLANEGRPGPGEFLTLYIKNPPDPHEAHVILSISHGHGTRVRWAECGGRDNPTPDGGPSWIRPTPGRIAEFPILRHFEGF